MGSHVRILRTQSGKAMPLRRPEIERALAGMGGKLAFLHGSEGEHIVMPAWATNANASCAKPTSCGRAIPTSACWKR